ncbi:Ferric-chelate reductase 1 [Microtus ochrogaster]|uniref:Ferric-chelate reductase 1 n=1 Tax=Microtus ochrogaster TaxID=79684 RepID=A0A8J6GS73_MICOH|nr:Ferric-chelate reductase 1 [Microtus ochrogaster]
MAAPEFTISALVSALLICSVASYPNGKVAMSCGGMAPQHGHSPQPEPVHQITLSQTKFKPGDQIQVTLSGPKFKGFLLEARDAEDLSGPPVGSFTLIDSEVSQLLTCEDVQGVAVSHTSSSKKTEINVYWNAPRSAPNHVRFLATVVEKYKIYWVKIPSHVLSQPNAPPFTTPAATAQPLTASPSVSHLTKSFSASECGSKKFCVRSPLNCDPETEPACLFLSFTRDDQSVMVEMSGPSEGYLSFALSRDQWMGDDDAYLCIREDQTVYIQPSYLTGRSYPVMESRGTLKDMAWRLVDGIIQCSFRRNITLPGVKNRFVLNESYYIFLAEGAAHDGRIFRHPQQPLITYEKCDVTGTPKNVGGSHSSPLLKAHGALMSVAWMTTVSIGVLVARFFRSVWSKAFFFGEAAWFQVHRMLMLATSVLTCVAFVLPFVYRGGWSRRAGYHPYLGCTVMTLAVLQPLLATFRPPLHDPRYRKFATFSSLKGRKLGCFRIQVLSYSFDNQLTCVSPLFLKVEILDDDRIQILQSLTVAEAECVLGFGAVGQVIPHPSTSGSSLGGCGKDNTADANQEAVGACVALG